MTDLDELSYRCRVRRARMMQDRRRAVAHAALALCALATVGFAMAWRWM